MTDPNVKSIPLDAEEAELMQALDVKDYVPTGSRLTPTRLAELQKIAKNTISDERIRISLRVPRHDLARLKAQALREGVPYQTYLNSILHKAAQVS